MEQDDLFGEAEISNHPLMREKYVEPPFSVINARSRSWQERKQNWLKLGIKSEEGRQAVCIRSIGMNAHREGGDRSNYTSVFDPLLCEVMYRWFCPDGGKIIDPFAGGSVRGIVANYLGYDYTGIDIRQEQIDSNKEQGMNIIPDKCPIWLCGDSNVMLDNIADNSFDFAFSCPPYVNLEVYSDIEGDLSNMNYYNFKKAYKSIISKTCDKLKRGALAAFVVGEVRASGGNFFGFVPYTVDAFVSSGMQYYNEAIYVTPIASSLMRVGVSMKTRKLVKTHQNILVFRKP